MLRSKWGIKWGRIEEWSTYTEGMGNTVKHEETERFVINQRKPGRDSSGKILWPEKNLVHIWEMIESEAEKWHIIFVLKKIIVVSKWRM